ncbi:hypothetical protein L7F22_006863 [Adiantum nelumboides]|nr:hypothetical protein [Adiantum nelumboides]
MAQSLRGFLEDTTETRSLVSSPPAAFEIAESKRFLQVNFGAPGGDGSGEPVTHIWMKLGSMVACRGDVKFTKEGMLSHGLSHAVKKKITGEGASLVKAESTRAGQSAQLYLASDQARIVLLRLGPGDALVVNGKDLLAFESTVKHKITMMKSLSAAVAGGLFNVRLQGHGFVAILSQGKPLTMAVGRHLAPLKTDPQATVAWSANLVPDFHVDINFKTLLGKGSGETFQMKWHNTSDDEPGFVIVQPVEETSRSISSQVVKMFM